VKISPWCATILLLAACLLQPAVGFALTLGQVDDFQDSTTQGWDIGATTPSAAQPVNEPTGGPAGVGDRYLRLTALGASVPNFGSRLSVFNKNQWVGNYLAAGVGIITMWVNNLGATDLSLRLVLARFPLVGFAPDLMAMSTVPVALPVGSGWTQVTFPLGPNQLTAIAGSVHDALTQSAQLRLVHNPNLSWPPPRLEASLGVDNITAVHGPVPLPFLSPLLLDE
jgi:hypothetical protein